MKEQNRKEHDQARLKSRLQIELPLLEILLGTKEEIEALSAEAGLKIIQHFLEEEIKQRCGPRGQQQAYRHGSQQGYVIYAGRKVNINKPRVRSKEGTEVNLQSYKAFQQNGRMQRAVARKLMHQVSTRNYEAAIDECLEGYGIKKSSVSRQWKLATTAELQKLCQRPVPSDLVALFIDGQYFGKQCLVAALGVDQHGRKHVLGLWSGATETSTVVRHLLIDLRERGLNTEAPMLVVIDGSKALYKGVREVFGQAALIQRCRVHKLRNVLEHLPIEKREQASWRLHGAWAKKSHAEALKELRSCVKWLEAINSDAARSLEEGMEETLTVTRLNLDETLLRTVRSTNVLESLFSQTEYSTRRVKHWRDTAMALRWGATALLAAEKKFHRIHGADKLHQLIAALEKHKATLAPALKAA